MYVGPETRLMMTMATLIYTVHSANNGSPGLLNAHLAGSKPAPSKGSDL